MFTDELCKEWSYEFVNPQNPDAFSIGSTPSPPIRLLGLGDFYILKFLLTTICINTFVSLT